MQWKHLSSPVNKKLKTQASAGKDMLIIFWDVNGPILVHFQEKGQTVISARYSDMLVNELNPAIRSKRRGLLSKRGLLLHDNARPRTTAHTVDKLRARKFEMLKHPPYSPELAPSDFHLFGPMKEHLRGHKSEEDSEVMEAVQSWLKTTPKSFFLEGIRKLVYRWTNCAGKQGDYVEKLDTNNYCK
jgi:histone-lysine N-methyltransferase SETMAR